eukprot:scaffold22583_cov106-Cylindrotheca_fusiformis.AAC.33
MCTMTCQVDRPTNTMPQAPLSPTGSSSSSTASSNGGKKDKESRQHFPCKVYEMLEAAEQQGHEDIVSWNKDGTGFTVHNKELFTKQIIPMYFNQTKYKSFQRQLSLYGFQRITGGENKGLRYHEKLRRGERDLCRSMKPIGYKPRSSEAKEAVKPLMTPHGPPRLVNESNIPAVISTNSMSESSQETQRQGAPSPSESVEFTADGFPEMGCFEGKTFYLMDSLSLPSGCNSMTPTTTQPVPPPPRSISSGFLAPKPAAVDGQMKRAWEIGFAVAMTMKPTPVPNSVPAVTIDSLDRQMLTA